MAATGLRGIDVRQTDGGQLVFRVGLDDVSGTLVSSGTATLYIYELQADGTLKSYDFNDNTFKTTALTTGSASMTHRTGNNSTVNTGIWTYVLSTLTGFTKGAIYIMMVSHDSASPPNQRREFMFGSAEGDSNIKKNQALSNFEFLMTDSTNHAPATGLTVSVTRSIDNGAFGAGTLSSVTELSDGMYKVDFAAADMNGNVILLKATATGADVTIERIITQP